jgi:hypothetical protein
MPSMTLVKHSQRTNRAPCPKCGATGLYTAHDTDQYYGVTCTRCHVNGKFVLINNDGSLHTCGAEPTDDDTATDAAPAMPALSTPLPATNGHGGNSDAMRALQALIDAIAPKVDANEVNEIIDARLAGISPPNVNADQVTEIVNARLAMLGAFPLRIEVTRDGVVKPITGISHKAMPTVLKKIMAGRKAGMPLHVYLHGPGGTGKTSIAPQIAEALELPYYPISLGPTMTESKLMGYMLATGYVGTQWTQAVEHGGIVLLDECDSANAAVLTVADAALANGHIGLPDGRTIPVHPDFIVIAAGNTTGNGADRMYVGRQAQDKAFLDRFSFVYVGFDDALEEAMCHRTGLDADKVTTLLAYVREVRANILTANLPVLCGMRASIGACIELAGGVGWSEVIDGRIRHGMTDTDWRKITADVYRPYL